MKLRSTLARLGGVLQPRACATPAARDPLLDALFERASDALLLCGDGGGVIACNPAARRMLQGAADRALEGRALAELLDQGGDGPLRNGNAIAHSVQDGPRPVSLQLTPVHAPGGMQVLVRVREREGRDDAPSEERLQQLANHDSLTGLPNRGLFRDRLAQAMARARRDGSTMALMFLDLDRFKMVNDELGHEVGDRLLQHVGRTLTDCLRSVDTVTRGGAHTLSRLGGDEFTLIVEEVGTAEDAAHVAQRVLEALAAPFQVGEEEIVTSASIGISMFPTDDVDLDTLIGHTDMAMYRSKSLGRGTYSFFSDDLSAAVTARVSLEGNLRRAIERNEFVLHFQPKADLRSGRVTGVEALLRWQRPDHGIVAPDRFVGVLEDTGMILPVGAWVIRAACEQLAAWDRLGLPPLRLAVNLSARQFRHLYLASLVEDSLRENGIAPERLEIELTESLLMEDNAATRSMLESFGRLGVRLAIDDFGTGHSSLSYLKRFSIDTLKIDRSFVASLPGDEEDAAICAAVIAMGHSLRMSVVAEGVETLEQAQALRELHCDEMQGWFLGRAIPGEDFAAWFVAYGRDRSRRRPRSRQTDTGPITLFSLID